MSADSSLWDQLVQAHEEVVDAFVDALNITNWWNGASTSLMSSPSSGAGSSSTDSSSTASGLVSNFFGDTLVGARRFTRAINWSEPFFKVLLFFHVIVFAGTLSAIRGGVNEVRFVAWMLVLVALVVASAWLNEMGRDYATVLFPEEGTQYFDEHGVFISVVYSAPMVLQVLLMMLVLVVETAKLFAIMKIKKARAGLKQEIRDATSNKNGKQEAGSVSAAAAATNNNTDSKKKKK